MEATANALPALSTRARARTRARRRRAGFDGREAGPHFGMGRDRSWSRRLSRPLLLLCLLYRLSLAGARVICDSSEGMAKVRQFKVQSHGRRRHSACGISTTSHHGFCRTLTASLNFKIKYTMSVFPSKNTGICGRYLYNELYIQSTC